MSVNPSIEATDWKVGPTHDAPPSARTSEADVWDRLWLHRASPDKDADLIRREEQGSRWRAIEAALISTFGRIEGLRTIELGAGRGDVSVLLAARGAAVTLLDRSQLALDQARERFDRRNLPAEYVRADLYSAAAAGGNAYDVSLSIGVVEHFRGDERAAAIRAHRTILRPGGMTIIRVPYAACVPYRLWKAYLELRGWWPYGMEIPYTKREMARLAGAAGFSRWTLTCDGFLQSVGGHLCKTFLKRRPTWTDHPCFLDRALGMTVTLFGWTQPGTARVSG